MYNKQLVIIRKPLDDSRALALYKKLGTEYDVQQNIMNKQVILVVGVQIFPDFDPLESGYNVLERAVTLSSTEPDDSYVFTKEKMEFNFH